MQRYRTSAIFVPGGMPTYTYVARTERQLERRIAAAKDNLCKLVVITGTTKCGKTVLVNRILPRGETVWVDGGAVADENDFWTSILDQLAAYSESTFTEGSASTTGMGGGVEGQIRLPFFGGKGTASTSLSKQKTEGSQRKLTVGPRPAAVAALRAARAPLVVDDLHYLKREFQGSIVRALKPLVFEGVPVVAIAIPHRRYDAVRVEKEMTGRLDAIDIPMWAASELSLIATEGFPLLNVEVDPEVISSMANEAYGSPHLMQEFCKELSSTSGIDETLLKKAKIQDLPPDIFRRVAQHTGKVIFDKLAKGPRQRTDRIQRQLRDGSTADIYKLTLLGLAKLGPGLSTIEYEQLRAAIRDLISDNLPQAHEITRVLEKMAEIASSDEASTPVLDFEKDEQRLHITDPFFAFFLKWGVDLAQQEYARDWQ